MKLKHFLKGISRIALSSAFVVAAGFADYYILWGINMATGWMMEKIVWIWDFVKTNFLTAIIIIGLVGVESFILELSSEKFKSVYDCVCEKFR